MTEIDLNAIEDRFHDWQAFRHNADGVPAAHLCAADLPALLAEVRQLREQVARLERDEPLALAILSQRDAQVRLLRQQRDQVLALCDKTRVGGAIGCNCRGIAHGTEHDYPGCPGGRVVAWDLDPDAVRAIFSASRSSQGEGGDPR